MSKNKKKLLIGGLAATVAVVLAVLLILAGKDGQNPAQTDPTGPSPTAPGNETSRPTQPGETLHGETLPAQTGPTDPAETIPGQTEPPASVPGETTPGQTVPEQTVPVYTDPTAPIPELDGSYEHWLSAAMVMAVSLEYPQFELEGVWAASATELSESANSAGAFLLIRVNGREVLIHSRPLSGERSQTGTRDLYTAQLGFATFDEVDRSSVDLSKLKELKLEQLSDMIAQSLLVTLYGH